MIQDLNAYNAWKRSTLDRMTEKYKREYAAIIQRHLKSIEGKIEDALDEDGELKILNDPKVEAELDALFERHLEEVSFIGVSDAYREITPKKELSTWTKWHWAYPVEHTFVELSEKKERDQIAWKVTKKIKAKTSKYRDKLAEIQRKNYFENIKSTFKKIADSMFKRKNGAIDKDKAKDIIQKIFNKTESEAERIIRTETTRYFNDARSEYFKQTDVDFVQIMAITDGRISQICEARDGYVIPIEKAGLKKYKPPFHWNCRSVQSPLDTSLKSDEREVKKNLGAEFGTVFSKTSEKKFYGVRSDPSKKVALPKGWA